MTGFGRAQQTVEGMIVSVELKSVNHRYFELASHLPRGYGFLDEPLRKMIAGAVSRGKIDITVTVDMTNAPGCHVSVNHNLAKTYLKAFDELSDTYHLGQDVSVMGLSRIPDVLTVQREQQEEQAVWKAVESVALLALEQFLGMRRTEGERLKQDILSRRDTILNAVQAVEERSPETVREYREKMRARLSELLQGAAVDEQRLLQEAAIYADKIAVAEETVRIRSHLDQMREMLESNEAVGRKLDFLVQEINREANTIGSKASDVAIARTVVEMKAEIEKIREQVQNIE